jgi:RimJ/RimL family protein N-acetyltransferase
MSVHLKKANQACSVFFTALRFLRAPRKEANFHPINPIRHAVEEARGVEMAENNQKREIATDRLCLRQFTKDDLEAYARIMGDHEVGKWFPKGTGYTREESKRSLDSILEHWGKHGFGIWAITDKERKALLGRCGLNLIAETSEVEVDFVLARDHWGKGYATEAAKAALAYGFEVLKLDRIIALAKPENTASRRVIEKIGMQYIRNAKYWDITCAYYHILKTELDERANRI